MFEFEKKFIFDPKNVDHFLRNLYFVSEESFTDTYFDTNTYNLTTKDIWLRLRNNQYELKFPLKKTDSSISKYEKIFGKDKISKYLNINIDNLNPVAKLSTIRKKYRYEDFIIDLDEVTSDDFKYYIGEIELIKENEKNISESETKILNFFEQFNLNPEIIRGKVLEYLYQKMPEHYKMLVETKVYPRFP